MERWTIRAFQGPCSLSSRARTFRRRSTEKSGRVDVGTAGKCGQAPPASMGHAPQMLHARLETVVCRPGHGRLHGLQPAQESEPRRSDHRTLAEAVRVCRHGVHVTCSKLQMSNGWQAPQGGDECGMSFSRHKRASWPTTLFTVRMLPQQEYQGVARSPPTTEETLQILEEHGGGLGWLTSGAGLNN